MRLPSCRRLSRRCCLLFMGMAMVAALTVIWNRGPREQLESRDSDLEPWINVKLSRGQRQYVDRSSGMRVIVGHFMGGGNDVSATLDSNANLTRELLDSNLFAPRPEEGKDGTPVMIRPHEMIRMRQLFRINRFNLMASDRMPLNRSLPDVRKKRCSMRYSKLEGLPTATIIIVFHNEAWSTLLRTVHSVINRSPRSLLNEILLVDDASDRAFLKHPLEEHVSALSVPTRVLRQTQRGGLVRARLRGARQAEGDILVFLDAHCEVTPGWLESLIVPIVENRTNVVCPIIDIISDDSFAYIRSFELHWGAFNWQLHFRWYTLGSSEFEHRKKDVVAPFRTPVMAGGLFAINKDYFFEIGSYDEQMDIWGGENLELSFRVWQCGGQVLIAPCSHVGHLFRKSSPYTFPRPGGVADTLYSNLARAALVWMDDWADFFFKYNPQAAKVKDQQSIRSRINLRDRLQCKSFAWYLENVWPEHFLPTPDRFFGNIIHKKTQRCMQRPLGQGQLHTPLGTASLLNCLKLEPPVLVQTFVMTRDGVIMTDESVCLDARLSSHATSSGTKVRMSACSQLERQKWVYHKHNETLVHKSSGLCLTGPNIDEGSDLTINDCEDSYNQKWQLNEQPWK